MLLDNLLSTNKSNLLMLLCLLIIVFVISNSHIRYDYNKGIIMKHNNKTLKAMLETNLGKAIEEYIGDKNVSNNMYDRVTIEIESKSYIEWLRSKSFQVKVADIKDNTCISERENIVVTEQIINGELVYSIDDLKFAKYEDVYIIKDIPTNIKIVFAEDSEDENGIIREYTTVYQKKN